MSPQNVELVRRAFELWNERKEVDFDALDPGIEWQTGDRCG
jgi:hypothetical protein